MSSWLEEYDYLTPQEDPNDIEWRQKICDHKWKPTILIVSVVYDCTKCNIKKEDYENWKNKQKPF